MSPVNKALWFVESHFRRELTLEEVGGCSGVSRYHLTRAFVAATGYFLMEYVRKRRLTEAARALAAGAPDILSVALGAGYRSHEAFTRAFHEELGTTPEKVRAERRLTHLPLLEPIKMDETLLTDIDAPRLENGGALWIAGISVRYRCESSAGIPAQWQRFLPHFGHVPGQLNRRAYGVRHHCDDVESFDYLCGVEVSEGSAPPSPLSTLRVPAQRYAVFPHRGHLSTIRRTWHTIWSTGLPASGLCASGGPDLELYGEDFDLATGLGRVEIWIPVKG